MFFYFGKRVEAEKIKYEKGQFVRETQKVLNLNQEAIQNLNIGKLRM